MSGNHNHIYKGNNCSRVGTFGTESAVRKRGWQQEFAVLKCEATANSVTGHVCVNSNKQFGEKEKEYVSQRNTETAGI